MTMTLPTHSSAALANRFLYVADKEDVPLDPMKLQKLVYITHGYHLGHTDEMLCLEPVQAWRWGPVFPGLYHRIKHWGMDPINEKLQALALKEGALVHYAPTVPEDDDFQDILIRAVWRRYRQRNAPYLSRLTHRVGTPWHQVWAEGRGQHNLVIPNDLIAKHYYDKLKAAGIVRYVESER